MNVWDETWELWGDGAELGVKDTCSSVAEHLTGQSPEDRARLRLASAAPEMARALLGLVGERRDETGRRLACPACAADVGAELHAAGCPLVAALRKAGVLPTSPPVSEEPKP
jgi:hypothetical protein